MGLINTLIYTSELILCSPFVFEVAPSATRHNIHMYPCSLFKTCANSMVRALEEFVTKSMIVHLYKIRIIVMVPFHFGSFHKIICDTFIFCGKTSIQNSFVQCMYYPFQNFSLHVRSRHSHAKNGLFHPPPALLRLYVLAPILVRARRQETLHLQERLLHELGHCR